MSIRTWQIDGLDASLLGPSRAIMTLAPSNSGDKVPKTMAVFNPSGATLEASLAKGSASFIVMDQACTISVAKISSAGYMEMPLLIDSAGFILTWADTVLWDNGTVPTFTSGQLTEVVLWTIDSWVNIHGKFTATGVAHSTPVAGKAVSSYQLSGAGSQFDAVQFNMATESLNVVNYSIYSTSDINGTLQVRYRSACNIANFGYCININGPISSNFIYATHATYTLQSTDLETSYGEAPNGAVDWANDYGQAVYMSSTILISFYPGTGALVNTISGLLGMRYSHTASCMFSTNGAAIISGNYSLGVLDNNGSYSVDYAVNVVTIGSDLPFNLGRCVTYGYDKDTDIGYLLGGKDRSTLLVRDTVVRYNGAAGTYTDLGSKLAVADDIASGMSQDGTHIWSHDAIGASVKFVVATEVITTEPNTTIDCGNASVVHGDTMIC